LEDFSISELVEEMERRSSTAVQNASLNQGQEEEFMMETSASLSPHSSPQKSSKVRGSVQLTDPASEVPDPRQPAATPDETDPYLAKMRASVAALGEVTRKLREGAALEDTWQERRPRRESSSRTLLLDSEHVFCASGMWDWRGGILHADDDAERETADQRAMGKDEAPTGSIDKHVRQLIENAQLQIRTNHSHKSASGLQARLLPL
jgi:hypothetical protein